MKDYVEISTPMKGRALNHYGTGQGFVVTDLIRTRYFTPVFLITY